MPTTASKYQTHVFLPARVQETHLMLVANLRFDRAEVRAYPQAIQSDAALSVAMAIDEQVSRLEASGSRLGGL
jgi:hypothetical protein